MVEHLKTAQIRSRHTAVLIVALLGASLAGVARGGQPGYVAAGSDGNLWFTEGASNQIGRITTAGVVTQFSIPTAGSGAQGIALGPDGNLWFTESGANKIGRITTAGVVTGEFPIPTASSGVFGIAPGPDGNLWFTENGGNKIGRITPAGVITEFAGVGGPGSIRAGPDGNLWFDQYNAGRIGRITTGGVITGDFPIPTAGSGPQGLAPGSDGNLWFAEYHTNQIGRITMAGVVTEFPTATAGSTPIDITAGPDGNLWFTEFNGSKIGRITTAGVITEFSGPPAPSTPLGIASGSDGNLWFAEEFSQQIGRITTAGVITHFQIPAGCPTIIISFSTLPAGRVGVSYSRSISVTPSGSVYTFSASPGLPPGLSIRRVILGRPFLSGLPTTAGVFTFTLTATSGLCSGHRSFTVEILATTPTPTRTPTPTPTAAPPTPTPDLTPRPFFTVPPCRALDTRTAVGTYGGPPLAAGAERTFVLAGQCGVPLTAKAVSLNITVTGASAAGGLSLYPAETPPTGVSTIDYKAGQTRANNAIARLGTAGDLSIYCDQPSGTVQVIVDVNGYYE